MNNNRRREISKIVFLLNGISDRLNAVIDEERYAFENMRSSDKICESEEAIDRLNNAIDSVKTTIIYLEEL